MDYIDTKYIRLASVYLRNFKQKGNDVYQLSCPICGDSKKDKTKARGFIFEKNNVAMYHCHNCGNPDHRSLLRLIKFLSESLYTDYKFEKFGAVMSENRRTKSNVMPDDIEAVYIDQELIKIDNLPMKRLASERLLKVCTSLSLVDDDHKAVNYLLNERKMARNDINKLFYLDDINKLTKQIDKYKETKFPSHDAILIPFIDFDGVINTIQLRVLSKNTKQRYLTLYLNDDKSKSIYGLNYIDKDKTVYALEGPINSMFLENAIAFAGSSQSNKLDYIKQDIKELVLIYDNDYRINPDVRQALDKSIQDGYKVVLYDNLIGAKEDINDIVIKYGWTKKQLMDYIKSRTFKGLNAKLELSKLVKPIKPKPTFDDKETNDLQEKLIKSFKGI